MLQALSLLLILLQQPIDDMSKLAGDADSGYGRSYGRLKRSFDATWQLFSDGQVLSADELEIQEAEARTLLELANIAKFGTWLVEGGLDSFTAAVTHFNAVFRCQLSELSPGLSQLYLGIKTHRTIESLLIPDADKSLIGETIQSKMMEGLEEPTATVASQVHLLSKNYWPRSSLEETFLLRIQRTKNQVRDIALCFFSVAPCSLKRI